MRKLLFGLALCLPLLASGQALERAQHAIDAGRVGEAIGLLRPLAHQDHDGAQWALARLLELPGRQRNLGESLRWYGRLAAKGSPEAMENLGLAHYLGRGVPLDAAQAAEWFRQAGERGEVGSQYLLASMLEAGLGVPKDLRLARAWYARAAEQGDLAAAAKRDELDRRLDAEAATAPP